MYLQRVLEHCKDESTQMKVMEEIMGSVSMLAQDQYGNYVVQVCNFASLSHMYLWPCVCWRCCLGTMWMQESSMHACLKIEVSI